MALETGNYISALVRTNPLSSDPVSEGDDHLQLIKKILQKTFPMGTDADGSTSGVGPGQAVQVIIAKSSAPTISGSAAESMGLVWLDTSANLLKIRNQANDAWITLAVDPETSNSVDVNAGTIDGAIIGGSSPAAGDFTTLATTGALTVGTDITISGDDIIMATNTDAYILVADGTSYNPVAISGDVTITNAGVVTIGADKVTAPKISFIDDSLAVTDTHIMIADGTDYNNKALSGDVTMTNTGAVTIADNAVTLAKQADGTQGGIIYYGGSGAPTELAAGTSGYVLKTSGAGANPAWVSQETVGGAIKIEDLEDVDGTPSNDQYLKYTSDSGGQWEMVNVVGDDKLTTKGDILTYNTVSSEDRMAVGTDDKVLMADADASNNNGIDWKYVSGKSIRMGSDAAGDTLYFNGTDYVRLAKGAASEVLTMNTGATAPEWAAGASGDITGVTAGTGLSGGGTSGAVTLNVEASQTQITAVGTIATGVWNGTDIAVADGGTGSGTASGARTNLGLAIGSDVQAYNVDTALVDVDRAWTASQRSPAGTDNDGSFDITTGNNFLCTPSGNIDPFEFSNPSSGSGQSGFIWLDNSGGHTISLGSNTKADANLATTITAAGKYLLSYFCDGTDTWVTNSAAMS